MASNPKTSLLAGSFLILLTSILVSNPANGAPRVNPGHSPQNHHALKDGTKGKSKGPLSKLLTPKSARSFVNKIVHRSVESNSLASQVMKELPQKAQAFKEELARVKQLVLAEVDIRRLLKPEITAEEQQQMIRDLMFSNQWDHFTTVKTWLESNINEYEKMIESSEATLFSKEKRALKSEKKQPKIVLKQVERAEYDFIVNQGITLDEFVLKNF